MPNEVTSFGMVAVAQVIAGVRVIQSSAEALAFRSDGNVTLSDTPWAMAPPLGQLPCRLRLGLRAKCTTRLERKPEIVKAIAARSDNRFHALGDLSQKGHHRRESYTSTYTQDLVPKHTMRPPRGRGTFGRGDRGGGRGGGGRFGGGGGRFGGGGYDSGPPDHVVEAGSFAHPCEGEAIMKLTNEKVQRLYSVNGWQGGSG
jgi:uncharacterized membrane protein YgcG